MKNSVGPSDPREPELPSPATTGAGNRTSGRSGTVVQTGSLHGGVTVSAPSAPVTAMRILPADIAFFTGRRAELERLVQALPGRAGTGGVVGISAIDGVGTTALAVHAAHQLAPLFPDRQLFVRLHGHTPGQRPVEPAEVLATLLLAVGVDARQIPREMEARAELWRDRMADKQALVVLDDAAGSEQVRPLLPGTAETLVLITSRRRLSALPGVFPVILDVLSSAEAAQLFIRLAGRPDLSPGDAAVTELVELYGRLPLAISLMAGQLRHRPARTAADLVADLGAAGDRCASARTEHAFALCYRTLPTEQRRLFRRLGLHPGADIDAHAGAARHRLDGLYGHHLIEEPVRGRYRLHDLIGRHARARSGEDPPADRDAALDRLLDYYLYTAQAADRHLARRTPTGVPEASTTPPAWVPDLPTREAAAAWMRTERLNLHAAAEHAAGHDRPGHTIAIPAAMDGFLRAHGHWDQARSLHHTALEAARDTGDRRAEAETLNSMGELLLASATHAKAQARHEQALRIARDIALPVEQARALEGIGRCRLQHGQDGKGAARLREALAIYRRIASPRALRVEEVLQNSDLRPP
ncbi:tetratricopeptide repeat protein [Allosalinactinospora lopnorensis]|uniref:tetratricopeptide repeat protein n=1 Tax=Allosalinactinospora lopnorensis TaxID=1352348 RepID=UPI00069768AD|nr:tetratricopeptide repeat protein [Allosalinactinospora lopnorensis]